MGPFFEDMPQSFSQGGGSGLGDVGTGLGNAATGIGLGALTGGPAGAALGGAQAIASLGKGGKGGGESQKHFINALGGSASHASDPLFTMLEQSPDAFKRQVGLGVLQGGLGAIGDMLSESQKTANAITMKQAPFNSNASAARASVPMIGSGSSMMASSDPNVQRLQNMQQQVSQMIQQHGSPQLKASTVGGM